MDEVFKCINCGAELEFGDEEICQDCEAEDAEECEWNIDYAEGLEYAKTVQLHLKKQTQAFQEGFDDNLNY